MYEQLINPRQFAAEARVLSEEVLLSELDERISRHPYVAADATVNYTARGSVDRWGRPVLTLGYSGSLKLICQRCLEPMKWRASQQSRIVFFKNESEWDAALAQDPEIDGLLDEELNLRVLLEDEILMALPFAPRHEACDVKGREHLSGRPNPFAVLAGLKKND